MALAVPSRRLFIGAAAALICSPAIVRASSLMPVHAFEDEVFPAGWQIMSAGEPYTTLPLFAIKPVLNEIMDCDSHTSLLKHTNEILWRHGRSAVRLVRLP